MFSTSLKSRRATGQASYPGNPVRDAVAMNHMEGSLSTLSDIHSVVRVQRGREAASVSICHSSIGDLESMEAPLAKQTYEKYCMNLQNEINMISPGKDKLEQVLDNQLGEKFLANMIVQHEDAQDLLFSTTENIVALYVALRDCKTVSQASAIIMLFIKIHVKSSLIKGVIDYVKEILEQDIFMNQSGESSEEDELPEWLKTLKAGKMQWKSATGNKGFSKVSKLLSMAAALGLCDISNFKVDINGIRIFSIPMYNKHVNALDLSEAIYDTFIYFVEGGYKCFQTRSLAPFMFSEDEAAVFEREYFNIIELAPLMRAGNMERVKGVSENDFDYRINKLVEKAESLYKVTEGIFEKKIMYEKLVMLRKIRMDFLTIRADGGLRTRPYAYYIHGSSGVGKSTVSAVLMRVVLGANGYDASDDRIVNLNEQDEYMSNYRSYINGVYCDDMGNTKLDFLQKSPMTKVIELVNNVKNYAVMAELELKGKVTLEPKCVGATSNVNLCVLADKCSNEQFSIESRFNIQVDVTVKKEFAFSDGRLNQEAVLNSSEASKAVQDLWDLKVYTPYEVQHGPDQRKGKGIRSNRQLVAGVNTLPKLVQYVSTMSQRHFSNQDKFLDLTKQLDKKLAICGECHLPGELCSCKKVLDEQIFEQHVEHIREMYEELRNADSPWTRWTNYVPEQWFDNNFFDTLLAYCHRLEILNDCRMALYNWYLGFFLSVITSFFSGFGSASLIITYSFFYLRALVMRKRLLIRELRDANGAMPMIFRHVRDNHVAYICGTCAILGIAYKIIKSGKKVKDTYSDLLGDQGTLSPKTAADIQERDSEINVWAQIPVSDYHFSDASKTTTYEQLVNVVGRNLVFVEIPTEYGTMQFCDGFFIKSNFMLLPNHMMKDKAEDIVITIRRSGDRNGTWFKSHVNKSTSYHIPNTDLILVYIPNSCSYKNLLEYIPNTSYRQTEAFLVYKDVAGNVQKFHTQANPSRYTTQSGSFNGYKYTLDEPTFKGLCGAVLVSRSVGTQILGFHTGGLDKIGASIELNKGQLEKALNILHMVPGIMNTKAAGIMIKEQYGVNFYIDNKTHPKSPLNFLEPGANLEFFGSVIGRSTPVSAVIATEISPIVEKVCGVPNKWGPPKFRPQLWKPWRESMSYAVRPSIGFEGHLVSRSVLDYIQPLLVECVKESIYGKIRPLTNMQTVCGIDGRRFIDKMKPNTSVGFPLSGPKREFLIELDPEEYDEFNCPMELDQQFWDEVERMESEYLQGRRCYPVFKASLKDEPTNIEKDKVRVFQAAPIAFQLIIRKYFLELARFLSLIPLVSECAVGVNAQGPEWNELSEHITRYGKDRILAGDYSKYDLRMPSQLVLAAFDVMIMIAKKTKNYSAEDISIMEGVATDIASPMMAYNGDLVMFFGSNPSGQNLTVYINSIVNSLIMRCAFFSMSETNNKRVKTFRDACSLMTYGDDVKSSVHKDYDWFNHISVANWLSERDMKFTMPDKESTPTKYMTDEDADFLKRKNIYCPEVGMYFGALDENSIFKSLHSVLKSSHVTNREQCQSNINGALREWFAHGREVYEKRRSQMCEIVNEAALTCSEVDVDYDLALRRFCEKYGVDTVGVYKLENQVYEAPVSPGMSPSFWYNGYFPQNKGSF